MGRTKIEIKKGQFFTGTEGQEINDLLSGFNDLFEKLAQEIKVHLPKRSLVLDVGCGEGKIWGLFLKVKVIGFDLSWENLAVAKGNVVPVQANASNFPFADSTFGLVVASEILEHLNNPEETIIEIIRVLKLGGYCILSFPNTGSLQFRLSLLLFGRNPALNYPENQNHVRFFWLSDMKEMLSKAGFRIEKVRGGSFLSFHQVNFCFYIPVPRAVRYFGGDWFPSFAWSNLLVLKKKD